MLPTRGVRPRGRDATLCHGMAVAQDDTPPGGDGQERDGWIDWG